MLFYIGWKPRSAQGPDAAEKAWEMFARWEPPAGIEFKGMWARADGGGFCVCEATSAEAVFEATAPWSGAFLDYEIAPIVDIEKAADISKRAIEFRHD
jgi:hypothetical protein